MLLHAGILQISNYLPPSQKGSHLRKFNLNKCTNTAYNLEARTSLQKQKRYVKDIKTENEILSTIQLHRSLSALPLYYYDWRSLVIIKTCIYKCTIKNIMQINQPKYVNLILQYFHWHSSQSSRRALHHLGLTSCNISHNLPYIMLLNVENWLLFIIKVKTSFSLPPSETVADCNKKEKKKCYWSFMASIRNLWASLSIASVSYFYHLINNKILERKF